MPTRRAYISLTPAAILLATLVLTCPANASTGQRLLEGCRLLQRGEYTAAADEFASVTEQDRFCEEALVGQGLACLRQGEVPTALEHFKVAATASNSPLSHFGLGAALYQHGDYAAARAAYQHALSLQPPQPHQVDAALAYLDCLLGLYDSAIAQARRCLEAEPGDPLASYALAASLYAQGRIDEALSVAEAPTTELEPASTWVNCCLFSESARYAQDHKPLVIAALIPQFRAGPADYLHQEPDFSIIYPQHLQSISGKVQARLRVGPAADISYVAVLLGDEFVGMTNVAPFTMMIDSTICPDGVQRLRVDGYNKAGRIVRKASIGVAVQNGNRTLTSEERACRRLAAGFLRQQLRLRPRPGLWEHLSGCIRETAGQPQLALSHYETAFTYSPTLPRLRNHLLALYAKLDMGVLRSPHEIHQLPSGSSAIALTFDDGPHPKVTPWILDQLDRYGAKATFFLVGKQVDLYPELTREIVRRGHQVASHSYTHRNLKQCRPLEIERELIASRAAIRRATGVTVTLFRPPGGHYDEAVRAAAAIWGFTSVFWTANIANYEGGAAQQVVTSMVRDIKPRAIVLLHNGEDVTVDILPDLLHKLAAQGMKMESIATACGHAPPEAARP